jgi:hypothetical protein
MPKSSVVLVLVAFLLTGLVIPTGAAGTDELWTEPSVVLEPHDGPNGQYASINGDGELEVDLSMPGLNAGAMTVIDDVFYVTNNHEEPVAIWFSHDAMDEVVLSIDGEPAQSSAEAVELQSGERASVGLTVDTSARSPGEIVLSEFTIHAENRSTPADGGSGGGQSGGSGGSTGGTADESDDSTAPSGGDEVVFDDGADPAVEIRSLPVDDVDELAESDGPPRPAIDAARAPRTLDAEDGLLGGPDGANVVANAGDSLTLTGERTLLSSAEAVQPDGRVVRLVEIDVPAERQDSPAYVRLAVDRASLEGTDPTDARIGRHTGDGWQLLETSVVDADDQQVVLQARAPGFSTFAVFADPAVSYRWELPNGQSVKGLTVDEQFDEPGRHEITLTVTDAQGRTASTDYELLVNDQPTVTIEAPESVAPGEPVNLRANVTNEIGNATVTWTFEDGTTVVGPTVDRAFEAGEHVVTVEVEDEYGATSRSTATLVVGESGADEQISIELFQLSLSVEERLVYAAIILFLFIAGLREWGARGRRSRVRVR